MKKPAWARSASWRIGWVERKSEDRGWLGQGPGLKGGVVASEAEAEADRQGPDMLVRLWRKRRCLAVAGRRLGRAGGDQSRVPG